MTQKQILLLQYLNKKFIENNVNFFAMGGTALGAARHQGFIPWDDDIDVMVKDSDFDKINNNISYLYFF